MKTLLATLAFFLLAATGAQAAEFTSTDNAYQYSFRQGGKDFPLSDYKGKVLLIVNTASLCGLAPQFAGLEKLYQTYKDKGLVVIGVPANDFGGQEPKTDDEIAAFTSETYQVTYPVVSKVSVTGNTAHPFYKWAGSQNKGGIFTARPRWNFHKYLVDKNGNLYGSYASYTAPDDEQLVSDIEKLLND